VKISAKIESITPRKAEAYLATMGKNRRVKYDTVTCYANDMAAECLGMERGAA
jgi:hypothetical protein